MTNYQIRYRNYNFKSLWYTSFRIIIIFFLIYGCSLASDPKKVLYISSYHPGFPTFFQQVEGIKTIFEESDIFLDIEFMDTKRFPKITNWEIFKKSLTYKLEQTDSYDAIMIADDNALIFALEQQTKLFNGKPIVFLGVNNIDRALDQNKNPQITGVVESVSMEETIELMIKLRPKATNILALVDNTSSGQGDLKLFYQIANKINSHKFSDISLSRMTWPDFIDALSDIEEESSVLLLSAYQDINNKTFLFNESLKQIKEKLSVPIFHLWYHGLGEGILGGKIISHYEQSKVAANIVLQILNGKPVEQIKVVNLSPNQYTFDYIELKKYNLHKSLLPKNSMILNEPHSFYQDNKYLIWGVGVIIMTLSFFLFFAIVNIYRRKQIEKTLRDREAHLHTVIETIPDLIWLKDLEGIYLSCNKKFERFFGAKEAEIVKKTDYDFVNKETADLFRNNDKAAMVAKKPRVTEEEVAYADDGHHEILETVKTPMYGADGQLIGVLGIARDITERKQSEKNKKKLEAQLQQAQKMESIGTLAGGIAHDFNNILFPIVGYTEMLMEDIPEDSPFRISLDEIYTGALRARDLTKQILTFSRQESSELKSMKMQPIIKEVLKLIRSTIPTTIKIKQDINADCGMINANPTQIHQVIMNLTTNAYHAMEDTVGELKVSLKEVELNEQDALYPDMTPGVYVCLTVADTGVGMDKDVTEKIFDPFFTTKERGKGTGLGLSVVYGIINSIGGVTKVYSEPGKGTEFYVYLPVIKDSSKKQKIQTKEPILRGTEQILLVDDEESIITMETQMLERLGYRVTPHTSSVEALDAFRNSSEKFDLVITDMAMPNMPGDKLAVELTKIRHDIPILLCTGFSETMSEKKAASLGIKGFLMKPIVMKDFSKKIREVLDIKQI